MTSCAGSWRLVLALIGFIALIGYSSAIEGRKPEQIYTHPPIVELSEQTLLFESFEDDGFPQRWQVTEDPDYTGTQTLSRPQ